MIAKFEDPNAPVDRDEDRHDDQNDHVTDELERKRLTAICVADAHLNPFEDPLSQFPPLLLVLIFLLRTQRQDLDGLGVESQELLLLFSCGLSLRHSALRRLQPYVVVLNRVQQDLQHRDDDREQHPDIDILGSTQ